MKFFVILYYRNWCFTDKSSELRLFQDKFSFFFHILLILYLEDFEFYFQRNYYFFSVFLYTNYDFKSYIIFWRLLKDLQKFALKLTLFQSSYQKTGLRKFFNSSYYIEENRDLIGIAFLSFSPSGLLNDQAVIASNCQETHNYD